MASNQESSRGSLGAYTALVGVFCTTFGGLLYVASKRRALPRTVTAGDILLLGLATHRLSRVIARDRVAEEVRAPFTEYAGSAGAGEVKSVPRGSGLQRAIGRLLTCQYCLGPWIASSMYAALTLRPRETRMVAAMLATTTVSDFIHQGYAFARRGS